MLQFCLEDFFNEPKLYDTALYCKGIYRTPTKLD